MSSNSRRAFIGLSLSAAGVELMPSAVGAREQPATADHPITARDPKSRPRRLPTLESVYLVVYRPGDQWRAGQPLEAQPLLEHGRYMLSLYREGSLRYAGGFADGSGGAAVFVALDDTAASRIVENDPAVVARVFTYDLRRWMRVDWHKLGSATDG